MYMRAPIRYLWHHAPTLELFHDEFVYGTLAVSCSRDPPLQIQVHQAYLIIPAMLWAHESRHSHELRDQCTHWHSTASLECQTQQASLARTSVTFCKPRKAVCVRIRLNLRAVPSTVDAQIQAFCSSLSLCVLLYSAAVSVVYVIAACSGERLDPTQQLSNASRRMSVSARKCR